MERCQLENDRKVEELTCPNCGEDNIVEIIHDIDGFEGCPNCMTECAVCKHIVDNKYIIRFWLDTPDDVCKECIEDNLKGLKYLLANEKRFAEPDTTRQYIANKCEELIEQAEARGKA